MELTLKEINKDVKEYQWQQWDTFKENLDRNKDIQQLYKNNINESKMANMQQRKMLNRELHNAKRKNQQYMAQDQLEKMKQRRQKMEMGAFYLKQHFDIK